MINNRLKNLPPASATKIALGGSGWSRVESLSADIFHALTGSPHPSLPKPSDAAGPIREQQINAALERKRERDRAIAAGEIT